MTSMQTYFEKWKDFETCEIYIAVGTTELRKEIENNCIYLSYPESISDLPGAEIIAEFLIRVKENRRQQLIQSGKKVELIYYSWFDDQAGQFRFCIINSDHDELPFSCSLDFVSDEKKIIEKFLSSFREVTIPWSHLNEIAENETLQEENEVYVLSVYKTRLAVDKR